MLVARLTLLSCWSNLLASCSSSLYSPTSNISAANFASRLSLTGKSLSQLSCAQLCLYWQAGSSSLIGPDPSSLSSDWLLHQPSSLNYDIKAPKAFSIIGVIMP